MHCLMRLEKCSNLQETSDGHDVDDADVECVATKKTKLLETTCSHLNECHLPAVCHEVDYCSQLLGDPRTAAMQWQTTLIQRHLAWTRRLCQSRSSPTASFRNSLPV